MYIPADTPDGSVNPEKKLDNPADIVEANACIPNTLVASGLIH